MYSVRGRSALVAFGIDKAIAQLWNPHSTTRIKALYVSVFKAAGGTGTQAFRFKRSTARGTPGSTVTPDIDNQGERAIAPTSGVLLDLGDFTVQPTVTTAELGPADVTANVESSGIVLRLPLGICVPPGTGLVLLHADSAAAWPISEITFAWKEEF